jgi:hypothetical protein
MIIQFIVVDEIPFGLVCKASHFGFIIGYCPSQRYLEIGFCQSTSGMGSLTTSTISPSGPRFGSIGSAAPPLGFTSEVGDWSSFPGGVLGIGIGLSSLGEVSDVGARLSSSSQMEGLNKSCANTPGCGSSLCSQCGLGSV